MSLARKPIQKSDSSTKRRHKEEDPGIQRIKPSKSDSWTDDPKKSLSPENDRQHLQTEDMESGSVVKFEKMQDDIRDDWQFTVYAACQKILEVCCRNIEETTKQVMSNIRDRKSKIVNEILKHIDHSLKAKMKKLEEDVWKWTESEIENNRKVEEEALSSAADEIMQITYEITLKECEEARYQEREKATEKAQAFKRDCEKYMKELQNEYMQAKEEAIREFNRRMHQHISQASEEVKNAQNDFSDKKGQYQEEINKLEHTIEQLEANERSLTRKYKDLCITRANILKEIQEIEKPLENFLDLAFKAPNHNAAKTPRSRSESVTTLKE